MATLETYDKLTLDMLNETSVSILKRTFAMINDVETQIGENWRRAFINSENGRKEIAEFLGEDTPQYIAVMQIWGETPLITEEIDYDENE